MSIPHPSSSSYASFRTHYLLPNVPVLLPPSTTANWAALPSPSHAWSTAIAAVGGGQYEPAYATLAERYGELPVEVIECGALACGAEAGAEGEGRLPETLGALLELWAKGEGRGLYLKDWHLPRILVDKGKSVKGELYEVPDEWADDWLNAYWTEEKGDDFRFLVSGVDFPRSPERAYTLRGTRFLRAGTTRRVID